MHGQLVFVRRRMEKEVYGVSSSSIDRFIKKGLFPPRKRIGEGIVGSLYTEGRAAIERMANESEEV